MAASNVRGDQVRYELAMRARNREHYAQELFSGEARQRNITVAALADLIIAEREDAEKRVAAIYEKQARILDALDVAAGEQIEEVVEAGVLELGA